MSAPIAWLDRVATPRRVVALLILELLALGCENLLDFPLSVPYLRRLTGHAYLDLCAFCSAGQIYAHLDAFGAIGRKLQLLLVSTVDIAIPAMSGALGALGIALLTRSRREARPELRWLILVPTAAMLLDYTENVLIAILTSRYPAHLERLAATLGLVSGVKTTAYLLTVVILGLFYTVSRL